jgi:hypothetical protein
VSDLGTDRSDDDHDEKLNCSGYLAEQRRNGGPTTADIVSDGGMRPFDCSRSASVVSVDVSSPRTSLSQVPAETAHVRSCLRRSESTVSFTSSVDGLGSKKVSFSTAASMPDDCDALLKAGPPKRFSSRARSHPNPLELPGGGLIALHLSPKAKNRGGSVAAAGIAAAANSRQGALFRNATPVRKPAPEYTESWSLVSSEVGSSESSSPPPNVGTTSAKFKHVTN